MSTLVNLTIEDGIAQIEIDHPPVNALSGEVRRLLIESLATAEADAGVNAIVLLGAVSLFSAGADLAEFTALHRGDEPQTDAPDLVALCARFERCSKPVIAGLSGHVLGAGLALALSAHFRLASSDAQFALPDIALGLIPAGGTTQRLPRLIGATIALHMILRGTPILAREAAKCRLIDGAPKGDLRTSCIELARQLVTAGTAPRPTSARTEGFADALAYQGAIAQARKDSAGSVVGAAEKAIDCVQAAQILPFDQGVDFEAEAYAELWAAAESKALRHVFLAEQRIGRAAKAIAPNPGDFKRLGVIGAGLRGAPVIAAALQAGFEVRFLEQDTSHLAAGQARVAAVLGGEDAPELERLRGATSISGLGNPRLIVEAMPDDTDLKPELIARLSEGLDVTGSLLTLSERMPLAKLTEQSKQAAQIVGFHPAGPAHLAQLVEVGTCEVTRPESIKAAFALARQLGMKAVRADTPVRATLWSALRTAAAAEVQAKAVAPEDLIAAFRAAGFTQPPLNPDDYPTVAPPTDPMSVIRPCLLAMANAASRLLDSNAVAASGDIDLLSVLGLGVPGWRGGPLHWAESQGLLAVRRELEALAETYKGTRAGGLFTPSAALVELGRAGKGFGDWQDWSGGAL